MIRTRKFSVKLEIYKTIHVENSYSFGEDLWRFIQIDGWIYSRRFSTNSLFLCIFSTWGLFCRS